MPSNPADIGVVLKHRLNQEPVHSSINVNSNFMELTASGSL
jgi:hypothetical protein